MGKQKEQTKEVVTTQSADVAEYDPNCLGACEDISAADLRVGRIAIMNALSGYVKKEVAKQGAIVDMETGEEIGFRAERPIEFIILKSTKFWLKYENKQFVSRSPAVSPQEKEWEIGLVKNVFVNSFFVLLKKDLDEGVVMPYEISFKATDLGSAGVINKALYVMKQLMKPSWTNWFSMSAELKDKKGHTWWGATVKPTTEVPEEYRKIAFGLYKKMTDPTVSVQYQEESQDETTGY